MEVELNKQLAIVTKKCKIEIQLDKEVAKRRKLEGKISVLKQTSKQQAKITKEKNLRMKLLHQKTK